MAEEKDLNLVIVTGGSRGLGKALMDAYEAREWSTLEFSRSGTGFNHMPLDLANLDACLPVLEAQLQTLAGTPWNRVVYINNAGTLTPIAPVRALTDTQIENNLAVNLVSGIRLMSAFVRAFATCNAAVIVANISSGAALKGYAGWPLYCAAKAGLENYIRSLAAEQSGSDHPLTCINIEPGVIDTEMQAEIRETDDKHFPDVARFIELKRAGQLRSAKSVARAIVGMLDSMPDNGGRYRIADHP
ncbi:MAG TPA: SDR family NAD(P)-dependent oxidoreductase [Burkholderiaceae bacterium]